MGFNAPDWVVRRIFETVNNHESGRQSTLKHTDLQAYRM